MKSGAEDDQHVGDEMDGTWTKKLKFGILGLRKLVGSKVEWYVIGQ